LEKLVLENFYSYGKKTEVSFSDGITVIVGENGAGKSSIVRAIYFALLGEIPDTTIINAIHRNRREFIVSLTLSNGVRRYRVERYRSKKKGGYDVLYVEKDGKEQQIASGSEEVTRKLSNLIFFSDTESFKDKNVKRILIDLIILNQGRLEEIGEALSSAGKDKIEFLMNLLGLSAYIKAWEKMKNLTVTLQPPTSSTLPEYFAPIKQSYKVTEEDLKEAESNLKAVEDSISRLTKEEGEIANTIRDLSVREKELVEAKAEIEEEKDSTTAKLGSITSRLSEAINSQKQLSEVENELKKLEDREKMLLREVEEGERLKKQLEELKLKEKLGLYLEVTGNLESYLKSLREIIPRASKLGLNGSIDDMEKQVELLNSEIDRKTRELEVERGILKKEIQDTYMLEKALEEKEKEAKSIITNISMVSGCRSDTEDIQTSLKEVGDCISRELQVASSRVAVLESEISRLERSIEELSQAQGKCPVCGRDLDEGHKANIISKYREELAVDKAELADLGNKLNTLTSLYNEVNRSMAMLGEMNSVREKLTSLKAENLVKKLETIEAELTSLGIKKENLSEFYNLIRLADNTKRTLIERSYELPELSISPETIEAGEIPALEEALKRAVSLKEGIIRDNPSIQAEDFQALRKKISQLEKKIGELQPEAKAAELSEVKGKIEFLRGQISDLRKRASEVEGLISEKAKLEDRLKELNTSLRNVESEISEIKGTIGSLNNRTRILKQQKNYLEELSRSLGTAIYELKVLLKVRSLYEREGGLPSMLMQSATILLRRWISEIYSDFEQSYGYVKIDESFNISLVNTNEDIEVSLDQASGGEKVALYLSFIFAAQRVVDELYGGYNRAGFIVLDEPTIYLDEQRVRYLADVLRDAISASKGTQIIVVTHEESLKQAGDSVLRVKKRGGTSLVEEERLGAAWQ